ncbi:MAG: porin family protein [Capnocytophaga sp.]|nr:porin family protein [Capnocytophaga sp.]
MNIKTFIAISLLLIATLSANAQSSSKTVDMNKLRYGLKAGGNLANVVVVGNSYSTMYNDKNRIGFYAGGYAEYPILDFLSARTELYYNNIGSRKTFLDGHSDAKIVEKAHYISLPILAKASLPKVPELYATIGFGFNISLSARRVVKSQTNSSYNKITKANDDYKRLNMMFLTSAGYHITDDMAVEIGFGHSFSTPFKSVNGSSVSMFRHQYLQLGVAYRLN